MKLNAKQCRIVEENMGLVDYCIKRFVQNPHHLEAFTYEDLRQIGYLGLCNAVQTFKQQNTHFSTYACVVIRNSLFNALTRTANLSKAEQLQKDALELEAKKLDSFEYDGSSELIRILRLEQMRMKGVAVKGVDAILMLAEGYSCKEIATHFDCPANHVTAWISKARGQLKSSEALLDYAGML